MLIQYINDVSESIRITRWLMRGPIVFGYNSVLNIFPLAIGGLILVLYFAPELNFFTVGEELAIGQGVDTSRIIKILFFGISTMIGEVFSVCAPSHLLIPYHHIYAGV